MKYKILETLIKSNDFLTDERISRELGISTNCVCENIEKLKLDGNEIEYDEKKGYRILNTSDMLCFPYVFPKTEFVGKKVFYFDKIDSTNKVAKETKCCDGDLFISDMQTNGRGRMGKNWLSPSGCGIWMSIVLYPRIDMEKIMQVSLVAGISVCESLNNMYGIDCKIKWPNDIVCEGKKICGILVETKTEEKNVLKVIVGIGVNVNNETFPDELSDLAVSLKQITGKKQKRVDIVNYILRCFEKNYKLLFCENKSELIIDKYKKKCINIGKKVVSFGKNGKICGTAVDISSAGELIILEDNGKKTTVNSGEVSVRGIYGYI